ncbi:MAG: type II and III secretion system protein family protein [Planctomycetota bacterium]|jgi:pilus assembly protein CpaC
MKTRKKLFQYCSVLFCLIAVVTFALSTVVTNVGYAANNVAEQTEAVTLIAGQSRVIKAPWPTVRVAVTDTAIADVQILTPEQVLLQGIKVGSTDLILWNENETEVWQVTVHVTLDVASIEQKLYEMFPYCSFKLDQSEDVLLVSGLLRSADQVSQLHDFLEQTEIKYVDMTSIAGVQQVKLDVKVAEVSRSATRQLGVNAFKTDQDYFFNVRPGSSSGGALVPGVAIGPASSQVAGENLSFLFNETVSIPSSISVLAGFPGWDLEFFIQALAENQYLRILSNPTLIALSGEEASFLAGGEFPIPVPQSSGSNATSTITVEYKEYGVRLTFRPTVLGDGTIRLYVAPEVSQLTTVGSVEVEGFSVPALTTRRSATTLELKSGQTFAMAGLISREDAGVTSKLPGLGDLPVIGTLFRSVRYISGETELVVLVSASLVEPMNLAGSPLLPGFLYEEPNDWELYIEGKIEGTKPAVINNTDAEWLQQMGMDKLIGPGAWDYYGNPVAPSKADMVPETNLPEKADEVQVLDEQK